MHKEHDTLYAVDPACRNFSLSILKLMIGIVLENMPGGMPASLHTLWNKAYTGPERMHSLFYPFHCARLLLSGVGRPEGGLLTPAAPEPSKCAQVSRFWRRARARAA